MPLNKPAFLPIRYVGPYPYGIAREVSEMMLSDDRVGEDFYQFMIGAIDHNELSYRLQVAMEGHVARVENPEPDCMDAAKEAMERSRL